ncbi:hypothetical protein DEU56DRAFT_798600 [Suillus clintonianus]|uniref:uncharacterized protein n=1 Tax=Suillus clintonianus TaxID=1904413 RepID=UPI001B87CFC8|nr:uncharacterized protein DEU56DRAFT_798600 [Suillus clintonianus]KAG2140096.1 hypothetical protein DEU56DRAFT_798600 [Suillus clintonianus]
MLSSLPASVRSRVQEPSQEPLWCKHSSSSSQQTRIMQSHRSSSSMTTLGDYLLQHSSRVVLKHCLDAFRFIGLRVNKALWLFLQSVHIPEWGNHGVTPLDVLLE